MNYVKSSLGNAVNWINTGANVANAGASIIGAIRGGGGSSVNMNENHHHYHERQLTPEEIKILQDRYALEEESIRMMMAMQMNQNATSQRLLLKKNSPVPESNDKVLYIVGGLLFVGFLFVGLKKIKN
ncbi:hypothetical protein ACF3OE_00515 [Capnocytophaga canis]|uniref:hypothetical protein n=1 Tax=Capnocytophaga canis TaxID=1848903 RepID=UPI00370D8DFD